QLLQAQVEPHFLFNTLANVQHLIETDAPKASQMLGSPIRYLRAALPRMREQATTLAREIEMVRAYLEIQRVRMSDRLRFDIEVPDALLSVAMPPMMLISLVENAVKHGIDPLPEGGHIRVTAASTPIGMRVSVIDTGAGLSEHMGIGIGLGNIRERLATLYGSAARLDLTENPPRGVSAAIEIPAA
ncbi:MAG: sensor histidine kinase, partial [Burkholderiaceae bacterium]